MFCCIIIIVYVCSIFIVQHYGILLYFCGTTYGVCQAIYTKYVVHLWTSSHETTCLGVPQGMAV